MSDAGGESPESHGVYGGTEREDGKMQEEPGGAGASDGPAPSDNEAQDWAEKTETGGDAT